MKKNLAIISIAAMLMLSACTNNGSSSTPPTSAPEGTSSAASSGVEEIQLSFPQLETPEAGRDQAVIKTSMGDITVVFYPEYAPKAVENFLTHAKNGYYDGLTFHRVMEEFMIQGGDPKGNGTGGESIWGKPFEDEFSQDMHHFKGALSMANSGSNTNGSQFFIVSSDEVDEDLKKQMVAAQWPQELIDRYVELGGTPWLDFGHTVFGQVVEGMDVLDAIEKVETDANSKPVTPVTIEKIEVSKVG